MSSSPVRVPEEQYRTQKEEQSPQNKDEAEEEDDYDSDDPENWGPYYWRFVPITLKLTLIVIK